MTKVKQTKTIVKELLEKHPAVRDNDNVLCAEIWRLELKDKGVSVNDNIYGFLKRYAKGEMTLAPTIKRVRAKLQEDHKELRGKSYDKRQKKLSKKWKKDLGYEVS